MKVKVIFILVSFVLLSFGTAYAQNTPPVLAPMGNQTVDEDYFWSFPVSASDVDGDALDLSTGTLPAAAYFVDLGNGIGSLYWQTTYDDAGSYDVEFYASDGQAADTVQITITVTNINRMPMLDPIGGQSILQGSPLTFTVSASDPDTNALALSMTSSDLPVEAAFTDNGDGTGSFVWNTLDGDADDYMATFTVDDGEDQTDEEITITILGRPQLETIGDRDVDEGDLLTFVVTAFDPDGDTPQLVMVDDAEPTTLTLPVEATFTDNGDGTGTFTWTPGFEDAGNYGARFLAIDNVAVPPDTVSETIAVTVNAVNRTPILAAIGDQTLSEGETLTFGLFATDAEGDSIYYQSSQLPYDAVLFDSGNGNASFTWSPPFSRSGYQQVISFYAIDHPAGGADTETVVFTVNMVPNESPVLAPIGDQSLAAESLFELTVTATDPNGTVPILNAADLPGGATFTDNGDGSGLFGWTPSEPDQIGFHYVTFFASDGDSPVDSEIVMMQVVTSGNQPPVLGEIADEFLLEGDHLEIELTATDADPTDVLTFGAANLPIGAQVISNGDGTGMLDWTPTFVQAGMYYITFFVTDGMAADSQEVQIRVDEAGNKRPLVDPIADYSIDEGMLLEFIITAYDPEGEPLEFLPEDSGGVVLPEGAILTDYGNDSALFSWTPSFCQADNHLITIVVFDGEETGFRSATIVVNEAGDQHPSLNTIGSLSVIEGDTLEVIVSAATVPGCDPAAVGTSLLPPNASFRDFGDATGRFRWIPGYTQGGAPDSIYHVTFYADDGLVDADSEVVEITITDAGNQLPVFDDLATADFILYADNPWQLAVKAYDADSTFPVLTTNTLPTGAVFADSGNGGGLITWTPGAAEVGIYDIDFYATDDMDGADTLSISLEVKPGQGEISILGVDGAYGTSSDTIITCEEVTFYFRFKNNTGGTVSDFKNRFHVYSPDPTVTWVQTKAASTGKLDPLYNLGGVIVATSSIDGMGADTAFFSGGSLLGIGGAPDGLDDTAWTITIGPLTSESVGKQICIDRAAPAGVHANWLWKIAGVEIEPAWDGPYCFTIFDPNQNQAPSFTSAPNDTTITECGTVDYSMAATDPDGVSPFFIVDPIPDGAVLTDNGDGTAAFSWTPTGIQEGVYDLAFITTDGCAGDTQMVTITVESEPPPVMDDIGAQTIKACSTLIVNFSVSDPGGPASPAWTRSDFVDSSVIFVDNGDGTGNMNFTPTIDMVGTHSITFYVTDSDCGSVDSEVVAIEVTPDDLPTLTTATPSYSVSECDELVITVDGDDLQGTEVTLEIAEFSDEDAVFDVVGNSGTFTWTPASGWAGEYSLWVYATDECGSVDSLEVPVTVVTDSLPIVTLSSFVHGESVRAGDSVYVRGDTVILSVSARDPEGEAMTIAIDSLPVGATLADNGEGLAVFTFFTEDAPKGNYFIEFTIFDGCGSSLASITLIDSAMISTGVAFTEKGELPDNFALGQNYPNPFNPTTIVEFDIPQRTYVQLDVYNVLGQHIRTLVDGVLSRQRHSVEWDGTSDAGVKVATGIYFYRMVTPEYQQTRKMVLVK